MRRMYLNLAALALMVFGMALSTTSLKGQILINLTNQVWTYDQSGIDPGAFWDPLFDDSAWPSGRSILAYEDSVGTVAVSNNILPYTNTVLLAPPAAPGNPNHTVDYFRTHFTFSGAGNPDTWVLTASNLIDDGYIMFLNGVEVDRYNMNAAGTLAAAANPAPFTEGIYVPRQLCIPAGTLHTGDNVLAVAVYQNAGTSSDVVWGTVLHASAGSAPAVTSPTGPVNIALGQGKSTNLTVAVQAAPCATYQWFFDPTGPTGPGPISGATATTYTVASMDASKAGTYFLRSVNAVGTTDSPNFNVTYDADTTAPTVQSATGNAADLSMITVKFSEDVIDVTFSPFDPLAFYLENVDNPSDIIGVAGAGYGTSSNIVILTLNGPRDPVAHYQLVISNHGIQDRFDNRLADPSVTPVVVPTVITIQEGLNGYTGTQDTEIRQAAPDSAAGGAATTVSADQEDPAPNPSHTLLRFDNLIGGGANQVPLGATVSSAKLRMWTTDPTAANTPIRVIRMLVTWDESSTWNSMVNGIDGTNGVETSATVDATIDGAQDEAPDEVDVTATVQAWANGAVNYGWTLLPSGGNGWDWATSENGTAANRPMLTVEFTVPISPCSIDTQPTGGTYPEKSPFSMSVLARGSELVYQWYFDQAGGAATFTPIPGPAGTGPTYSVARAVPANSGRYYVTVQNNLGICTSVTNTVTITPDTTPPALTSAVGNFNQTTISLTFNDTLDPTTANNPSTYSLSGGIGISGVLVNGSSVTLTQAAPRVVGQNYTLTITGLKDDAVALNTMPTTTTNLAQQFIWLPFGATWKFETNGLDLGTAWSQPGYNDSAWPSATSLLGFEPDIATQTNLYNQGLNTNNMMLWQRTRPDGTTNITYYLRTTANLGYDTTGATLQVRHVTDDGALYYINGTEVFRYNMPAGAVNYLTGASSAPGEGVIRSSGQIPGIPCGNLTVAVELHNQNITSSDILFDGELLVTVPQFNACPGGGATLSIVNNGNGTVTLSWTGSGTLQESTDLTNWTPSANQNNPQTFAPVGVKFYRVQ